MIVANLPGGKGDQYHVEMFKKMLLETHRMKVSIACIIDNDYDMIGTNESRIEGGDGWVKVRLGRKEIENYLISPQVVCTAAEEATHRRQSHAHNAPKEDDLYGMLTEILDTDEIRSDVRYQVVPKYRDTLGNELDDSTKERRATEWFNTNWLDQDWRIRNCPGKKVLSRLRKSLQDKYAITVTPSLLVAALRECPEDIERVVEHVERCFCGTAQT